MTCSSHGDRRGDSGLLVGQVCRSGRPCGAKTCWHGDAGLRKVLDSVAAGSAELLSGTGVGFASSCFFTDMLNASNSRGPRSAQRVWPHTASSQTHSHTHTHVGAHAKKHTSRTNTRQSNKCKQTNKQPRPAIRQCDLTANRGDFFCDTQSCFVSKLYWNGSNEIKINYRGQFLLLNYISNSKWERKLKTWRIGSHSVF